MDFEMNTELVLSTGHIPYIESRILTDHENAVSGLYEYEYGYRIWVGSDIRRLNLPITRKLIKLAEENGCKWLVLDQDGNQHHGELTVYDW